MARVWHDRPSAPERHRTCRDRAAALLTWGLHRGAGEGVERHDGAQPQDIPDGVSQDIADSRSTLPGCRKPAGHHRCHVEERPASEVARSYGVARSWVYKLLARYRAEGEAAFEPRSRRPKTSPSAIRRGHGELILGLRKELAEQGLDAGPDTIGWHLHHHHQITVSRGHDQPAPDPGRAGHPRAEEATEVLLHPVRSRAAQRDLAVRLHPLPAHRTGDRHRDHHLARRPLPLRPVRHRPPPGHRPDRARHLPRSRCQPRASPHPR